MTVQGSNSIEINIKEMEEIKHNVRNNKGYNDIMIKVVYEKDDNFSRQKLRMVILVKSSFFDTPYLLLVPSGSYLQVFLMFEISLKSLANTEMNK